jgi:circadian clock protein KaiB
VKKKVPEDSVEIFEEAIKGSDTVKYVLRLYIAGVSPRSSQAVQNIKRICDEHLEGRYDLQVIDILQHPVLAAGEQILAAPTLIKKLPPPLRRFIGNMANVEKILLGLDLQTVEKEGAASLPKEK